MVNCFLLVSAKTWSATDLFDFSDKTESFRLNYVNLKIISNPVCQSYYTLQIVPSILCGIGMSSREQGVCSGDSGGPLVIERDNTSMLIGIVSFSQSMCGSGAPSGFTRVSSFLTWIKENMN